MWDPVAQGQSPRILALLSGPRGWEFLASRIQWPDYEAGDRVFISRFGDLSPVRQERLVLEGSEVWLWGTWMCVPMLGALGRLLLHREAQCPVGGAGKSKIRLRGSGIRVQSQGVDGSAFQASDC